MRTQEARRRVVGYAVFLGVAGVAWWGLSHGLPRWREVVAVRTHRSALEAMTRQARSLAVRSGGRALEDSITLARARLAEVQALVPEVGTGEGDGDVRRLVAALAEHSGVVVRSMEEGPGGREGALIVSTARVSAAGRYHDVGAWLSGVEAARRLVQVTDVTMSSAGVAPDGNPPVVPGTQGGGTVMLQASLRWFRRDSSAAQDSTNGRQ